MKRNKLFKDLLFFTLLSIVFTISSASFSFSQNNNWKLITTSDPHIDGRYFNYYLDTTSVTYTIKNEKRICRCIIKNEYIKDKKINFIIETDEINCSDLSKTVISATVFFLDGTKYSADLNEKSYPKPGTSGEWIINNLCDK